MNAKIYTPSPKYQAKLRLIYSLIALGILAGASVISFVMSTDRDIGFSGALLVFTIVASFDLVFWLIAMFLTPYYFRSLSYEIQDDEVIVRVGIWTQSIKHVPYRTVTNLSIKRDILDRWFFNTGTLNIQTAGMSGTQGAEEKLVGLPNVQEVYEIVVAELRRFRGAMAPTAAAMEEESGHIGSADLHAILEEVQAIRQVLGTT